MKKMTRPKNLIHPALLGALVLGAATTYAAPEMKLPEMKSGWEACGGVAKAGMNDCAVKTSLHSCVGLSKADGEADSYLFLPAGACNRIVNGKVLPVTKQDVANVKAMLQKKMK